LADRKKYLHDLERIMFTMIHGCQMFTTVKGRLGIVGSDCNVHAGDSISLLHGGPTPYILREIDAGVFRLMGPCWVADVMNGIVEKGYDNQSNIIIT